MTTTEMVYVLDKLKDCVQIRGAEQCNKDCRHCTCYMEPSSMLDAIERIISFIFHSNGTKKSF